MSDSIWKKDLSLRRKSKSDEPELPPAPVGAVEPAVDAADAPDVPNLPAGDYGWLTSGFDPDAVPDNMPVVSAPEVTVPAPAAEPVAAQAAAAPTVVAPDVVTPEPLSPEAALFAAAVATAATEEAAGAVPFWKKELKLSRPKLERGSKQPKEPKQAKPPKEPKVKGEQTPFWKLELGKSKQPKEPKEPKEPKVQGEQTPFWKLELGRSKGPKQPKQPKVKGANTPFWKLELGGKAAKLPQLSKEKPQKQKQQKQKTALVGLKIGASQVAAARVSNSGGPQLLQVAREPLADGIVVGGELRDVEGLAEALKELFTKNKLPKKNVRLGIANNRIGVRTFEISGIDEPRQLANAIRFRAQETLPIPLEEAVLDWRVLDESQDPETGEITRRVLLVVAYRELVDRYLLACRKAGIRLTGIDLEAFAMLRALNAPLGEDAPDAAGAQVVVNVGHDRSTFAVSNGRVCEFTRVLGWGGQSLSVAIARALDMTPSEATPIKHALSLVAQAEPPADISPETLGIAREAVMRELQAFARELVSSLRFYQNQPGSLGIGELVLTGGTAHLPGFADELNKLIGVPVKVGDPLNRIAIPKKFTQSDEYSLGSLTVAIGLGIED